MTDQKVMDSIKISKIIPPILMGLAVVGWLMYRQLDFEELKSLEWSVDTIFWVGMAILAYVFRHLFYSWRLRILTDDAFSWAKSIELITIWEFASSVSPTSIGGSGVALFLLAQERLPAAKTVSVVIYSVVIDTLFFVLSLGGLFIFLGPIILRPGMQSMSDIDGFGYTFLGVLVFMIGYGFLFFYGLFINPNTIKRFMYLLAGIPFLKRFSASLKQTGDDVVSTSLEMRAKSWTYHLKSFLATCGAWTLRFLAINFLILAFISDTPLDFYHQILLMARGETMYVTTAMSPTPGAAGIAELVFGGYYSDYVPKGVSSLIALVWRVLTYYSYLIAGAIIIPVWYRELVISKKRKNKEK